MDSYFMGTEAPVDNPCFFPMDISLSSIMPSLASTEEAQVPCQEQIQCFEINFEFTPSLEDDVDFANANITLDPGADFNDLHSQYPALPSTEIPGYYSEDLPNTDLPNSDNLPSHLV